MFSDINQILYERADEFYKHDDGAASVDLDCVRSYTDRTYPNHAPLLHLALDSISDHEEVSTNNILHEFIESKKRTIANKLATALLAGNDEVTDMMEEYGRLNNGELQVDSYEEDLKIWESPRYEELSELFDDRNRITLYPNELNKRVRAVRGAHILIYARPETGKTLFTINMVRGFLDQGLRVLYFGNEDPAAMMLPRFMGCVLNSTREELDSLSGDEIDTALNENGWEGFIFIHLEPGTFKQIRGLIGRYSPDVVILDQLRNLGGGEGLVVGQEIAGKVMRNIGNVFNVLSISIAQAGESAAEKLRLGLSDVDSSKTGLPATTDVMIGLGTNEERNNHGRRMVSLPKNKLGGDHSFFSINVDESRSRVLEIDE